MPDIGDSSPESTPGIISALVLPPVESEDDRVEFLYRQLENKVKTARPKDDVGVLEKTYRYARECHGAQKRRDGSPYMTHPLHVTLLLAGMQMDMVCLQTGLLHDV